MNTIAQIRVKKALAQANFARQMPSKKHIPGLIGPGTWKKLFN